MTQPRCPNRDFLAAGEPADRLALRTGRSVYATRATFISLAEGGGADRRTIAKITHPSPKEAFDLYERLHLVWPELCRAVEAVKLPPVAVNTPKEEVTVQVTAAGTKEENTCSSGELQALTGVGAAGFEPATPAV